MSDMREAGKKKKLKLKLPHLWNPHKIKKIRQDDLFRSKDEVDNHPRRTYRVKRSADLPTTPFFREFWGGQIKEQSSQQKTPHYF